MAKPEPEQEVLHEPVTIKEEKTDV
jgi:hypothetical protein